MCRLIQVYGLTINNNNYSVASLFTFLLSRREKKIKETSK